jgi:membrane protein
VDRDLSRIRLLALGKAVIQQVGDDDVAGLAAELAYRFLLAIFPFFIFLTALGGFIARLLNVENPAQQITVLFGTTIPPEAAALLQRELDAVIGTQHPALLSFGIVGTLLAASGGMQATTRR